MGFKRFISRLGFLSKEPERSLLFVANEAVSFVPLTGLIESLVARDSRLRIILSSADSQMLNWLRRRFPALTVLPLPYSNRISAELYLRQLKIRAVAFVEVVDPAGLHSLLEALKRLAIGVVTISGRAPRELPQHDAVWKASEALVWVSDSTGQHELPDGVTALTETRMVEMLGIMLARDLKAMRKTNMVSQIAAGVPARLAASPRWRKAVGWRVRRYQDVDELRERLASPKTIMCLGNGPSSEDPGLVSMAHDVLFRVNHSWLRRGVLVNADVVFSGGKPSMRAISGSVFGVPTTEAERYLLALRSYNPRFGATQFFNVNDMTASIKHYDWGHLRPTNGICMLATAVVLNPDKLIVAGVDLFQHPEGSYPGDSGTANAYSPGHNRETELEFIMHLFSGFSGELVIVGDVLRSAWERHKMA